MIYFQHSFSGPNMTHHALRDPRYQPAIDTVTSVNAQITNLAPVAERPDRHQPHHHLKRRPGAYKWHDGHFYVFAGNRDHTAKTGTMGLSCLGNATAVKLGEDSEQIPSSQARSWTNSPTATPPHLPHRRRITLRTVIV